MKKKEEDKEWSKQLQAKDKEIEELIEHYEHNFEQLKE